MAGLEALARAEEAKQTEAFSQNQDDKDPDDFAHLSAEIAFGKPGPAQSELGDPAIQSDQFIHEQLRWVRATGETPLEFLVRVYRSKWTPLETKVQAAKAALDFVNKRVPRTEVVMPGGNQRTDQGYRDKLWQLASGLARDKGFMENTPMPEPVKPDVPFEPDPLPPEPAPQPKPKPAKTQPKPQPKPPVPPPMKLKRSASRKK